MYHIDVETRTIQGKVMLYHSDIETSAFQGEQPDISIELYAQHTGLCRLLQAQRLQQERSPVECPKRVHSHHARKLQVPVRRSL